MRRYLPGILIGGLVLLTVSYSITVLQQKNRLTKRPVSVAIRTTDPIKGDRNAAVSIVVFGDYQCESCKDFDLVVESILKTYGKKVRLIWKDFPLASQHADAQAAAEAARCAQDQGKFWAMHDQLMGRQAELSARPFEDMAQKAGLNLATFKNCYQRGDGRSRISEDLADGQAIGVSGTPTVVVNSLYFTNIPNESELSQAIEQLLKK